MKRGLPIFTHVQSSSIFIHSCDVPLPSLLHGLLVEHLPVDRSENQRLVVRRKHIFEDALTQFKNGVDANKYLKVTFLGEPAVDDGGPLREFFNLLIAFIARNNNLFCGDEGSRVPRRNMTELEKKTYYHVRKMLAMSLVHGGPAPHFFSRSVAQYIVYGMNKVVATTDDVADEGVKEAKVAQGKVRISTALSLIQCTMSCILYLVAKSV